MSESLGSQIQIYDNGLFYLSHKVEDADEIRRCTFERCYRMVDFIQDRSTFIKDPEAKALMLAFVVNARLALKKSETRPLIPGQPPGMILLETWHVGYLDREVNQVAPWISLD